MKDRDVKIIQYFLKRETGRSSDVFDYLIEQDAQISLVTVKRDLARLVLSDTLAKHEKGPETFYEITAHGRMLADVNAKEYCEVEPDKRYGQSSYNFSLLQSIDFELFSSEELQILDEATKKFQTRRIDVSETLALKELERFVIELSWKSSKIEGNTYTLLDTEKLIKEGIRADNKSNEETTMILNHKSAFDFVYSNKDRFKVISRSLIEDIHLILIKNLEVEKGYRKVMVGVIGSKYKPLDNEYQIREAMEQLFLTVNKSSNPYSKALLALLLISYIQPFEDGNKRTSRLTANAILLSANLSPLSYRSLDEEEYRQAILTFYELNSIIPFKKIFIAQYVFAAEHYLLK